jgi:hypothetical protein
LIAACRAASLRWFLHTHRRLVRWRLDEDGCSDPAPSQFPASSDLDFPNFCFPGRWRVVRDPSIRDISRYFEII